MIDNLEESEDIQLPDDTMKILLDFLKEKEQRETSETTCSNSAFVFEEDWVIRILTSLELYINQYLFIFICRTYHNFGIIKSQ